MLEVNTVGMIQMIEGVDWAQLKYLFALRDAKLIPSEPWDARYVGEIEEVGNDDAFGGYWSIRKRPCSFEWYDWQEDCPRTRVRLEFVLRGELPLDRSYEPIKDQRAQRRWYLDCVKITRTLLSSDGEGVIEAKSLDDAIKLLQPQEN